MTTLALLIILIGSILFICMLIGIPYLLMTMYFGKLNVLLDVKVDENEQITELIGKYRSIKVFNNTKFRIISYDNDCYLVIFYYFSIFNNKVGCDYLNNQCIFLLPESLKDIIEKMQQK